MQRTKIIKHLMLEPDFENLSILSSHCLSSKTPLSSLPWITVVKDFYLPNKLCVLINMFIN